jgi:hypothetical protein
MNTLVTIDLVAAHQNWRDHQTWNDRANKLVKALREARCDLTRDYLRRGLALAQDHVARLEPMLRIAPAAEPVQPPNLNSYGMGNAPTSYRSATGARQW